jgi:hypothetical protein
MIRGTAAADTIYGLGGNDTIYGFGGNDKIVGGPGKDRIYCGSGIDRVTADRLDRVARDCEVVSRPSATATPTADTPTAPTSTTPSVPAPTRLGTRTNPHPVGSAVRVENNWTVKVVSTTPDATAAVLAENMFNDPPTAGNQFYIVRLQATYHGTDARMFLDSYLRVVGTAGRAYSTFGTTSSCGVAPDEFYDQGEIFAGASVVGNACFQVPSSEVSSLVMYWDGFLSDDVYLALR